MAGLLSWGSIYPLGMCWKFCLTLVYHKKKPKIPYSTAGPGILQPDLKIAITAVLYV
jgi:hypothetical protein